MRYQVAQEDYDYWPYSVWRVVDMERNAVVEYRLVTLLQANMLAYQLNQQVSTRTLDTIDRATRSREEYTSVYA